VANVSEGELCKHIGIPESDCKAYFVRQLANISQARAQCHETFLSGDRQAENQCYLDCGVRLSHGTVHECVSQHLDFATGFREAALEHRNLVLSMVGIVAIFAMVGWLAMRVWQRD
jgi:hypothetical protein